MKTVFSLVLSSLLAPVVSLKPGAFPVSGGKMPTAVAASRIRQQLADHVIRARAARRMHDTVEYAVEHDTINELLDQLLDKCRTTKSLTS